MTIEDDQIAAQQERMRGKNEGGAKMSIRDARVTSALQWVWTTIGAMFVAGVYWVASSITTLNVTMEKALVRLEAQDKIQIETLASLKDHERRISTLEGRNLRGAPEELP